jgi:pilus assembly protein Flp/PilA
VAEIDQAIGASRPKGLSLTNLLAIKGDRAMSKFVTRFLKDESGATAIEYGLIASLIAAAIIGGVTAIGTSLQTKFNSISTTISG